MFLTKISATLAPHQAEKKFIGSLFGAGARVFRLNTAHLTPGEAEKLISAIRSATPQAAIMFDTKGSDLRLTQVETPFAIGRNQIVKLKGCPAKSSSPDALCVNYSGIAEEIDLQSRIFIDDGLIELQVVEKEVDSLICRVVQGGTIQSRKSVNVPGVETCQPAISQQDKVFLRLAAEKEVDCIAHSFTRTRADVRALHNFFETRRHKPRIVAKIENQRGINNLEQILQVADGILIARGDLGVEIGIEKIPAVQEKILRLCRAHQKPCIVVTHLLQSMLENPSPTRSEISDIAHSVFSGADLLMLTGETAKGKFPAKAVETLQKSIAEAEKHALAPALSGESPKTDFQKLALLCARAVELFSPAAVVVWFFEWELLRALAAQHFGAKIVVCVNNEKQARQCGLLFGVFPVVPKENDFYNTLFFKKMIGETEKIVEVKRGNTLTMGIISQLKTDRRD